MVVEEIKVKRESRERKQSREEEEEEEEAAMIVLGMCFLAFEREILNLFVWGCIMEWYVLRRVISYNYGV